MQPADGYLVVGADGFEAVFKRDAQGRAVQYAANTHGVWHPLARQEPAPLGAAAAFEAAWVKAYAELNVPRDDAMAFFLNGWVLGARYADACRRPQSVDVEGVSVAMEADWRPSANVPLDGESFG